MTETTTAPPSRPGPTAPAPSAAPDAAARGARRVVQRVGVLDLIRLGAALMVVSYHYLCRGEWGKPGAAVFPTAHQAGAYGWLGVELFFMVSGFVICMSCWGRSLGDFFVSRVVRLYPAYWFAVVAVTVVVTAVPGGMPRLGWPEILTNFTMLQQLLGIRDVDGVFWTLAAELRFYVMFALVVRLGVTYRRVVAFCIGWALLSLAVLRFPEGPVRSFVLPEFSWYFIAGMAFYLMYRFRPNALLVGIVALCFLIVPRFALARLRAEERWMEVQVPEWPVLALLVAFFAVFALIVTRRLDRVSWRWLPAAGALTYPLYLLHESIGWELIGVFEGRVNAAVLVGALVAGMLLLAWLVHRLVERPAAAWLKPRLRRALDDLRNPERAVRAG